MPVSVCISCFSNGESAILHIPELHGQLNSSQIERVSSLDAHVDLIAEIWVQSSQLVCFITYLVLHRIHIT
ncbi:hypothetical protein ES332_A05G195200v1 [Gossypium tomentosum]|uniref:Uncharacterized protein n=1 Tax=Gossypium tomentosum TaxID=34277 RepID=A0A5D2QHS6_GOSTO|nr:hypothetical protein ES332_A05G195200v1 [Gossypium tomentosum]